MAKIMELLKGRSSKSNREVVQPWILHSCEGWSWNKEMVDSLHGWESRNLDRNGSKEAELGIVSSESNQDARKKFAERGGECISG